MLWDGPYPESLKQRVGGNLGHLSNTQAINFLKDIQIDRLKTLVVSHVSEQNNCIDLVDNMIRELKVYDDESLIYSNQENGCKWIDVESK